MVHFVDGSAYPTATEGDLITIGWIDAHHEFARGPVPSDFVHALTELCRTTNLRTRGWHYCNLCVPDEERANVADYTKSVVTGERGSFGVGSAEIRIRGPHGLTFVAPDMVIHYVLDHSYAPPQEFVDAVLREFGDASVLPSD